MRLTGKVAVVLGAGDAGAARGAVLALAGAGATVVGVDASRPALDALTAATTERGLNVATIEAAIDEVDSLTATARRCAEDHSRIDVLVTCHLRAERTSIANSTPAQWEAAVNTNLLGPVYAVQAFLPLLRASGRASVVHLGSVDGHLGNPTIPMYSATKGALVPLTHVMAHEFAGDGIRVNCIARAVVADGNPTNLAVMESVLPYTPLGRLAEPDELGQAVVFFASDDSSYCTGSVLTVDGGRTGITPGTGRPG